MLKRLIAALTPLKKLPPCPVKRAARHAHHGFHTAYLWYYVLDWHLPVSGIVLPLAVWAVVSWIFPHLELGE